MTRIFLAFIFSLPVFISQAQNADIRLLREINLERNRNLDNTFTIFSGSATPVSISVPVIILTTGLIRKDNEMISKGITISSSIALAALVSTSLKYSINRTRPYITYPDIEKLDKGGSPSFPSGHTSTAFSTATALSVACPRWYVIIPSYAWAGGVAWSRMHLGVHYPSDVLFGAATGTLSVFLCRWGQKKLEHKNQANDEPFIRRLIY